MPSSASAETSAALTSAPVLALNEKTDSPYDYRIKTVIYNPMDVVQIDGVVGLQTLIQTVIRLLGPPPGNTDQAGDTRDGQPDEKGHQLPELNLYCHGLRPCSCFWGE